MGPFIRIRSVGDVKGKLCLPVPACLDLGWGVAGSVKPQTDGSRKTPPG